MDAFVTGAMQAAPAVAVLLTAIVLVGYIFALALAYFFPGSIGARLKAAFEANLASNLGIPCSAVAAFALVGSLWKAYPPSNTSGELSFKAFSLEFTGPSGPITLWVLCFLAFIAALKLLRLEKP
jgi:hypothetical protein